MPIYEYEILSSDGTPTGERVEIFQSMRATAYTHLPECGRPCRRAICLPRLGNRVFAGDEERSRMHWCDPSEYRQLNQAVGVNNYRSDGTVRFENRRDEQTFVKKVAEFRQRVDAAYDADAGPRETVPAGRYVPKSQRRTIAKRPAKKSGA